MTASLPPLPSGEWTFHVIVSVLPVDHLIVAECVELPGCVVEAPTVREALARLRVSVEIELAAYQPPCLGTRSLEDFAAAEHRRISEAIGETRRLLGRSPAVVLVGPLDALVGGGVMTYWEIARRLRLHPRRKTRGRPSRLTATVSATPSPQE